VRTCSKRHAGFRHSSPPGSRSSGGTGSLTAAKYRCR
jgi:hypothetical protein